MRPAWGPEVTLLSASGGTWVGIGGRVEGGLTSLIPTVPQLRIIGEADLYFPTGGTVADFNANVVYGFAIAQSPLKPYAGAGLDFITGNGASSLGLSLVGGTRFARVGSFTPFIEARGELHTDNALVIAAGLLF